MSQDSRAETVFLLELFRQSQGDPDAKVSMFAVGEAVGLDKTEAGKLAETLIGQGWVEIKTLSGGIGITREGLEAARAAGASGSDATGPRALGDQPVMNKQDRQSVADLQEAIKTALQATPAAYETLEALVMDIKTLEVHLLSPKAKTAVVREILRSINESLESLGQMNLAAKIRQAVGSAKK